MRPPQKQPASEASVLAVVQEAVTLRDLYVLTGQHLGDAMRATYRAQVAEDEAAGYVGWRDFLWYSNLRSLRVFEPLDDTSPGVEPFAA